MGYIRTWVLISILLISACSIQELADKAVPSNVLNHSHQAIDAIFSEDPEFFTYLRSTYEDPSEFDSAFLEVTNQRSGGNELSRDLVQFNSSSNYSTSTGSSKNILLVYELKTEDGFTVVNLNYQSVAKISECCPVVNINVAGYDQSPILEPMRQMLKVGKIIGAVILLALLALIIFLFRRSAKRKQKKSQETSNSS